MDITEFHDIIIDRITSSMGDIKDEMNFMKGVKVE